MNRSIIPGLALLLFFSFYQSRTYAQEVYADYLVGSSSDFQYPQQVVDADHTNYASLSRLLGILTSSSLRVRFPVQGNAGDVVHVTLRGTGELLGTGVLDKIRIRLYDSLGAQVADASGSGVLQLSLQTPGDSVYAVRYFTDIAQHYRFKEAEIIFSDLLSLTLLSELRVYNVFFLPPCPPVYADSVYAFKTANGLTDPSYVANPGNAVDADPNSRATLNVPVDVLDLFPPAYLDLKFSQQGRAGNYVGFTIGQASSLLELSLLQDIDIQVYDETNTLVQTKSGFALTDLELLSGTGDRYTLGFLSQSGSYRISRLRISLGSDVSLLQDLYVYNAFHYTVDRPSVTVTVSGPLSFCAGDSVTLTAHDGLGATNYEWSTGTTGASITVRQTGVYSVHVTDVPGCTRQSVPVSVQVFTNPRPVITGDTVLCAGAPGVLRLSGQYAAYSWSGGGIADSLAVAAPGIYYVSVTDSNGCRGADTMQVAEHRLAITASVTSAKCSNTATGAISLNVTGGSGSYQYRWSDGSTGNAIGNLDAGMYVSTITDQASGCTYNRAFTVTADNRLSLGASVVHTSGCGEHDGRITLNVTGGSGNYSYSWSNGATTAGVDRLAAGIYTVSVTDVTAGCQQSDTLVVSDGGNGLSVTPSVTAPSSCSSSDGSISLAVTGGSGTYSYLWSTGAVTSSVSGLQAGIYYAAITDAATQCTLTLPVTLTGSTSPEISGVVTPASCHGNDGSIQASVAGSTETYTYSWSNGMAVSLVQQLRAGTYIVEVTGSTSGCSGSKVFVVGEAGAPAATLEVTQPPCAADAGAVTVHVAGNSNRFFWSNGSAQQNQANLRPGIYVLTVTDTATGCASMYTAEITPPAPLHLAATPSPNTACAAAANGSVAVTVSGGRPPYSYNWSNGATTPGLVNISAGVFTLTVTDSNGCHAAITVPIYTDSSALLHITLDSILHVSCADSLSGGVYVTVSSGVPPYTYLWSNGAVTEDIGHVAAGSYTLTVTDDQACTAALSVTVEHTPDMLLSGDITAVACHGDTNGSIHVAVTNGSGFYEYSWNTGAHSDRLAGLGGGSYTITVKDIRTSCTASETFVLEDPEMLRGELNITNDTCTDEPDGRIRVTPFGGTPPYSYTWSSGVSGNELTGLEAGAYTVWLTDAHGCADTIAATVRRSDCNDKLNVYNGLTPNGDGINDSWIIEGIGRYPDNEVTVFDKWGDVVFRQSNYRNNWSGTGINGSSVPDGTYFYLIRLHAKNRTGGPDSFTGSLLIQR